MCATMPKLYIFGAESHSIIQIQRLNYNTAYGISLKTNLWTNNIFYL